MNQGFLPFIALLAGTLHHCSGHAQDLLLSLVDGSVQLHAIADIRSIKFEGPAMSIHYFDGSTVTTPFAEVRSYSFTGLNTRLNGEPETAALKVHPNPTNGPVRVGLPGLSIGPISMEVVDAQGRVVDHAQGGLALSESFTYDPRHLGAGLFLLRLVQQGRVHTTRFQVL